MNTIEEKAKAYDESVERAKQIAAQGGASRYLVTQIFPELRESEDERIRKSILEKMIATARSNNFFRKEEIEWVERTMVEPADKGEISDGYHTFNELYYYRMLYNAAFFNMLPKEWVHKSERHHDGEECFGGGWFIVVAKLPTGQISNHYELKYWDLFRVPVQDKADEWDGHTPQVAAERLHEFLLINYQYSFSWSDDDEKASKFIAEYLERLDRPTSKSCLKWLNERLKSLRPQPHWKPSEEQMEALMLAIEGKCPTPTSYLSRRLEDLYEGLANTYGVECDSLNKED